MMMTRSWPAFLLLLGAGSVPPARPVPIPVRYAEGVTHGFLTLKTTDSTIIAIGDLLQRPIASDTIETRMLFHFKDGSVMDETTRYSQRGVFRLQSYHSIQRGPAFKADIEVRMERSGAYRVTTRSHEDGKEKTDADTLDLPADVGNGMVMLIAKNLPEGAGGRVHYVAFTPKPRIIELVYTVEQTAKVPPADLPGTMVHYRIHPDLGTLLKVMSAILGKTPPDMHAWVIHGTVPAFARFVGPLSMGGPEWRIETTSARWPAKAP